MILASEVNFLKHGQADLRSNAQHTRIRQLLHRVCPIPVLCITGPIRFLPGPGMLEVVLIHCDSLCDSNLQHTLVSTLPLDEKGESVRFLPVYHDSAAV